MNKRHLLTPATVGIAALLFGAGTQIQQPAAAPVVATVDLEQVSQAHPRFQAERKRINDTVESRISQREKQLDLDGLNLRIQSLEKGTLAYESARMDLGHGTQVMRDFVDLQKAWLDRESQKLNLWFFDEVQKVVDQVAAAKGIDLVLRDITYPDPETGSTMRLSKHERRYVLYRSKGLMDITPEVCQRVSILDGKATEASSGGDDGR